MAKFQIKLLTPLLSDKEEIFSGAFLKSEITSYDSELSNRNNQSGMLENSTNYTFSHTYDEEVSYHQNSQKELKFKMNRKIMVSQGWIENPYARNIHIGTILLFEDKNDNSILFIVKEINYTVRENNIIYDVSCQDLFSYQLSRQSQNYYIKNDEKSADFLGAFDVNYWAKKIVEECKIIYEYVPTNKGVCVDKTGNAKVYNKDENIEHIHKIVKNFYNEKEYNRSFIFSLSKVSASQALIKLAETIGMNLVAREFPIDENSYRRMFWFEPKKKIENYTGLTYSPYNNIQNFSFSHRGNSLTTVLDVKESKNINGEIITMLPSVTGFWKDYFMDYTLWNNSNNNKYTENYFKNIGREKEEIFKGDKGKNNKLVFKNVKIPKNYDTFSFGDFYSGPSFYQDQDGNKIRPSNEKWVLRIRDSENNDLGKVEHNGSIEEYSGKTVTIAIQHDPSSQGNWIDIVEVGAYEIHLFFKRNPSKEDLEFAEVADELPWLENKVIDFKYFLDQNLVTKYEYSELEDLLKNQLRILNGKILAYSDTYFKSKQATMERLTDILIDIDNFGGIVQETIIDKIAETGTIDEDGSAAAQKRFVDTYRTIFSIKEKNLTPVVDYNKVVANYFNKYFNAQQGFLKNMYNFREYYNRKVAAQGDIKKFYYTIETNHEPDTDKNLSLSFASDNFLTRVDKIENNKEHYIEKAKFDKPKTSFYVLEDNKYKQAKIVTEENYQDLYLRGKIQNEDVNKENEVKFDQLYDSKKIYAAFENSKGETSVFHKFLTREDFINSYIKQETLYTHGDLVGDANGLKIDCPTETLRQLLCNIDATYEMSDKDEDTVKKIVYANCPLSKLYGEEKEGSYIVDTESLSTNKNASNWIRVNDLGQTSQVYLEYLQNKYIRGLSSISKVANPHLYKKQYEYNVANNINSGDFYRRVSKVQNGWKTVADHMQVSMSIGAGGGSLFPMPVVGTLVGAGVGAAVGFISGLITAKCNAWSGNNWDRGGLCKWDFYGKQGDGKNGSVAPGTDFQWAATELVYTSSPNDYATFYDEGNKRLKTKDELVDSIKDIDYVIFDRMFTNETSTLVDLETRRSIKQTDGYSHDANNSGNNFYIYKKDLSKKDIYHVINNWKVPTISSIDKVATTEAKIKYKYSKFEKNTDSTAKQGEKYYIISDSDDSVISKLPSPLNSITQYWATSALSPLSLKDGEAISNEETLEGLYFKVYKEIDYSEKEASKDVNYKEVSLYKKSTRQAINWYKEKVVKSTITIGETNYKVYCFDDMSAYVKYKDKKETEYEKTDGSFEKPIENTKNENTENKNTENINNLKYFYKNEDGDFIEAYTLKDANNQKKLYVLNGGVYIGEDFYTEGAPVSLTLIAREGMEEKAIITQDFTFVSDPPKTGTEKVGDITKAEVKLKINNKEYSATITRQLVSSEKVENVSNGDFWFKYHSVIDKPKLFQISASIETQLSEYWTQAYTYSKHCEYFLPEYWQPFGKGGNFNYFCNATFNPKDVGGKITGLTLTNVIVPNIVRMEEMPSQYMRYREENIFNQENSNNIKNLSDLDNTAIHQAIREIGFSENDWTGENIEGRKEVYYYTLDGGQKWSELVQVFGLKPENYPYFSGQYVTILKQLKDNYMPFELSEYDQLLKEKSILWKRIYTSYSNLILENSYENQNVSSSKQLLELAKLYLDDYNNPERQYNITTIDGELSGYINQELTIGDPIELNADEFYDEYDDVKATLKEKLFISDISYTLRRDNDIKLTVNNVKYEDKIMRKLVNLIG